MLCVGFKILWKKEDIIDVIARQSGGNLDHDLRLWEAEAALAMRFTLEKWYRLPLIEREQIIATRVADKWIENVMMKQAVKDAK